jgi:demethylmenaquinone methyltransferase/2-methoxy-6-polyprenyl-1,4-benzoquinol methylase
VRPDNGALDRHGAAAVTASDPTLHAYYAARAAEYDRIYLKPERQPDLRQIEAWLPPRFAGAHMLEIACGTGYWTRFLAAAAASVLAMDIAPETMAIARSRVPADKVRFSVGDAYALPRAAEPFEAAFAGFWLSHVPKRRRREFLAGLGAVLKPGARVVLLDNRFVPASSSPIAEEDADGDSFQARRLADGTTHRVLKNFPSQAELLAMVEGIGTDASVVHWNHYWALAYASV